MGNPIACDAHDRAHLADYIVSRLSDGDSLGLCESAYVTLCRAVVDAADAPEIADATDAAVAALEAAGEVAAPPTSEPSSAAAGPVPDEPMKLDDGSTRPDADSDTGPRASGRPGASVGAVGHAVGSAEAG